MVSLPTILSVAAPCALIDTNRHMAITIASSRTDRPFTFDSSRSTLPSRIKADPKIDYRDQAQTQSQAQPDVPLLTCLTIAKPQSGCHHYSGFYFYPRDKIARLVSGYAWPQSLNPDRRPKNSDTSAPACQTTATSLSLYFNALTIRLLNALLSSGLITDNRWCHLRS